jgi:CheY-like chemotaxis protein
LLGLNLILFFIKLFEQQKLAICRKVFFMQCQVLIVEDDQVIRELLKEALEMEGYTTHTVTNGKEALHALKEILNPCVILLDLMMPVMNGWQFLESKNNDNALAPIPVVVMTAASNGKLRLIDTEGLMRKPIDLAVLTNWVQRFCGKQSSLAPA